jgi:hypothetical protein
VEPDNNKLLDAAAMRARAKLHTYYNPAPQRIENIPIIEDDVE